MSELEHPLLGIVDPWELTAEEIDARIDESNVEGQVFRQILANKLRQMPATKVTVDGLLEMPGMPQLDLALSVLTADELRSALALIIHSMTRLALCDEAFEEWVQGGPEPLAATG